MALALSIFRADSLGKFVVTRYWEADNFHVHLLSVSKNQHLSWCLISLHFNILIKRSVHPASPALLTKVGPLKTNSFRKPRHLLSWNDRFVSPIQSLRISWIRWISKSFNHSLYLMQLLIHIILVSTILGEISIWTSYQIFRLVFRPFIQIWRTICTSVPFRTSIRISPDFVRFKQSSISFGSHQMCTNTKHRNWCSDLKGI